MIRYATLFEVHLMHDYFMNRGEVVHEALSYGERENLSRRYRLSAFLDIIPTAYCQKILRGHKMIFKTTQTGFCVAAPLAHGGDGLLVTPGADFNLSFALRVSDARFCNYTAQSGGADQIGLFSNTPGNEAEGGLYLSAPIADYDATRTYAADDVYSALSSGTRHLYRAVRDTGPAATPVGADWQRIPADTYDATIAYAAGSIVLAVNRVYRARIDNPSTNLHDSSQWELLHTLANQYVSDTNQLPLKATACEFDVSGASLTQATLRVYRIGAEAASWEHTYTVETGTLTRIALNLQSLPPGAYHLEVLDSALNAVSALGRDFYLDNTALREHWLGVIEIARGSGNFALLDGIDKPRGPRFQLRFRNRATRWRYYLPAIQAVGAGAEVAPEGGDARVLITPAPRPMTQNGTGVRLQNDDLSTPTVSEQVLLPEPEVNRIRRADAQWFSEIHLSNLPL